MTMTREKIEDLKSKAYYATSGNLHCSDKEHLRLLEAAYKKDLHDACTPEVVSALLSLAERALEPQGNALPELPPLPEPEHDYVTTPGFTASQMHAYARAYASQLALPAGPVPGSAEELAAVTNAKTNAAMTPKEKRASDRIKARLASPSPAVAQPVADEREVSQYVCSDCGAALRVGYTCDACGSFSASTPEEYAQDTARAALCQPAEEGDKA